LLAPATVSELASTTRSMAKSANTDLAPSDLVGFAWLRFHSDSLIRCSRTRASEGQGSVAPAERRVFLGQTTVASNEGVNGCRSTSLGGSSVPLPPKRVIKAVGAAYPMWRTAVAALIGALLLTFVLIFRAPLSSALRRLVRGVHPATRLRHLAAKVRRAPLWSVLRRLVRGAHPATRLRHLAVKVRRAPLNWRPSIDLRRRPRPSFPSMHNFQRPRLTRLRVTNLVRPSLDRITWSVRGVWERGWSVREGGVPGWAVRNRGDIGLYVLVTALAAAITFLILVSVA
jgi:hypothetical protein